jgi:hypothetical protein
MSIKTKPPISFWVITTCALLWNIIEIYLSSFEISFLQENSTAEEFEKIQSIPFWYAIIFIVSLFSEILGSFMLFMRKKIATKFFAIALIALVFIELYWLIIFDIEKTSIIISIIIPVVVIIIAIFLYLYSKRAVKKGWIK